MYEISYSKQAIKDIEKLKRNKLFEKYKEIENKILENPYSPNLPQGDFSKLKGTNIFHARLGIKHRIFYKMMKDDLGNVEVFIEQIEEKDKIKEIIKIL